VFNSVDEAKHIWSVSASLGRLLRSSDADSRCRCTSHRIKGQQFSIPNLLDLPSSETDRLLGPRPSVAIFRLAPQDYHRFHAGLPGVLGPSRKAGSTLYTVNPQAVNEDLDVFTANRREIRQLAIDPPAEGTKEPTAFVVAVGAMLVGSILWEDDGGAGNGDAGEEGWRLAKGEPCGAFAYGGSTVILVTPTGSTEWDADLARSSREGVEQLVRAGERIGRLV
jgi:phosphatidylserine decarboxylase